MDSVPGTFPYWIVAVWFVPCLGGVALITWYATKEHYRRKQDKQQIRELTEQVRALITQMGQVQKDAENYQRIKSNRLYRESFESVSFAALHARRRLQAAEAELQIARELLDLGAEK